MNHDKLAKIINLAEKLEMKRWMIKPDSMKYSEWMEYKNETDMIQEIVTLSESLLNE